MSKVIIEVDTQVVGINVSIDGQQISDVDGVSIWKKCCCSDCGRECDCDEVPPYVSVTTLTENEEMGLNTRTYYSSAEAIQSPLQPSVAELIPSFVVIPQVANDIAKFLH